MAAWRSARQGGLPHDEYERLGHAWLDLQEPLLAFDIASEGLRKRPDDVRLRRLRALALARSGSPEDAEAILSDLLAADGRDRETLETLADVRVAAGLSAATPADRERYLRGADTLFKEIYASTSDCWSGVNAATLALILGETPTAKQLAGEIRDTCRGELRRPDRDTRDWTEAILAEAELILGEWDEAERLYRRADQILGESFAAIANSRRNARLILEHSRADAIRLDRCFRVPKVAVFAGHRVDQLGRAHPRFPASPEFEAAIRSALRERVAALGIGIGYAAAASGSDILFLETVREAGGRIYVVLPCRKDQFVRESVQDAGEKWVARFEDLYNSAEGVILASNQRLTVGSLSYDYSNLLLYGLAQLRAEQLDTSLTRLAVWDGAPGDGRGGTADIITRWRERGDVHVIDPGRIQAGPAAHVLPATKLPRDEAPRQGGRIVGMLFSDVEKFSGLTDEQIPLFVEHFLLAVADLMKTSRYCPEYANTWGDGLFLVFGDLKSAGRFALELLEFVKRTKWGALGLRDDLRLRIALHAGPVYEYEDPFRPAGMTNYIGTHVNWAARIEPVTPAGYIYVSQSFAALTRERGIEDFQFTYAGETELPKAAGVASLYGMRPATLP